MPKYETYIPFGPQTILAGKFRRLQGPKSNLNDDSMKMSVRGHGRECCNDAASFYDRKFGSHSKYTKWALLGFLKTIAKIRIRYLRKNTTKDGRGTRM